MCVDGDLRGWMNHSGLGPVVPASWVCAALGKLSCSWLYACHASTHLIILQHGFINHGTLGGVCAERGTPRSYMLSMVLSGRSLILLGVLSRLPLLLLMIQSQKASARTGAFSAARHSCFVALGSCNCFKKRT